MLENTEAGFNRALSAMCFADISLFVKCCNSFQKKSKFDSSMIHKVCFKAYLELLLFPHSTTALPLGSTTTIWLKMYEVKMFHIVQMKQKTTTLTKSDMSSDINSLHASYHKKNQGVLQLSGFAGDHWGGGCKRRRAIQNECKKKRRKRGKMQQMGGNSH